MAKRAKTIKTTVPGKGDLVVGHSVYAFFPNLPAVPGKIISAAASGHSVIFEISEVLRLFGLPRKTEWTWRASASSYQPKTDKTKLGVGLAIVKRT